MISREASIRLMRSAIGGCVEKSVQSPAAKNMCETSAAAGASTFEPPEADAMRASAPAMPSGLRVYCTAEASARNSLCRLTAALIRLPMKLPMKPITIMLSPIRVSTSGSAPLLLSRLERLLAAATRTSQQPSRPSTRIPCTIAISRTLSRMSPCRMWLNSWAITPCSSSRESCSAVPRVTPITALSSRVPAAKALIPLSWSSR